MKYTQNLNGVKVGEVGQFLINENGAFKVIRARLINETEIEKVIVSSKPIITTAFMLSSMGRADIITLSLESTLAVIQGVKKQGCKHGCYVHFEETASSGARYSMEEALKLGEGVGYKVNAKGERVPCVMPKEERIARGLERVVSGVMVFDGDGEKDLYNPKAYHSESVIDSLAK